MTMKSNRETYSNSNSNASSKDLGGRTKRTEHKKQCCWSSKHCYVVPQDSNPSGPTSEAVLLLPLLEYHVVYSGEKIGTKGPLAGMVEYTIVKHTTECQAKLRAITVAVGGLSSSFY